MATTSSRRRPCQNPAIKGKVIESEADMARDNRTGMQHRRKVRGQRSAIRALTLLSVLVPWLASGVAAAEGPPAAAHAAFTIEEVMRAPFASDLVAAPNGRAVAWVLTEGGVRNVWVAVTPEWVGRRLTPYAAEDGQELSDLAFSPDASRLVYVRGGLPNRKGEIPNPTSDTGGAEQAVWVISVAGGEPKKLGPGHSPSVAPVGDRIAFVREGQVYSVGLDGENEAKALFKARGEASTLAWSPDASHLAFCSRRGDHSFVGVFDVANAALRWMDPGVDRDVEPLFSPDGRRVAFLRLPAEPKAVPFLPEREGQPWEIRVADAATGRGRLVFRASAGRGSVFRGLGSRDDIFWTSGDRIAFPWERDGWTHLYSVPIDGGEPTLLTPGEFEVEHASLAMDGLQVLFSSNEGDVDRRHVWQVRAAGGRPEPLTSGQGIEWSPVAIEKGGAVVLRSDARRPSRAAVVASDALRDLGPAMPDGFPAAALVAPQQVVFPAADGLSLHGQLFLPPAAKAGEKRPAVVFFHGGSRRQMLLGWHYMLYYHNCYAFNQYLASRGYVVLAVNYRSGIGYGLEFREALDYGAGGASEFNDVLGAGLYLRGRGDVDPARIGLWGGSYGGYLTALGLARASSLFAAGVDLHGVHDWNVVIHNFVPSYDPESRKDLARLAFESSPMASVATWRSPVLLVHGDDDRNVPFSETVDLAVALRQHGVDVEELVFPDEIHDFLLQSDWTTAFVMAADFFERRMPGR
jgi:dipeptidyl aminopeptidase/acylaminoacyl peptidase